MRDVYLIGQLEALTDVKYSPRWYNFLERNRRKTLDHWLFTCEDMAGSSHAKKIRRLKRKIRLQASEHAQDIEKYKTIIEDLNYERDIVNLYFMWLYITSTNRQGWDRDGSMAHHGIKKSRPDWILHIMTKTIKRLVYYTFVVIHKFLKNKKVTWVTNRNEWWNCVHVYY